MAKKKKRAPAKKRPAAKKSLARRAPRKAPAKKKRRRSIAKKKNPGLHPTIKAGLGGVLGAGTGVGLGAAMRYFGVGTPMSRGIGLSAGGLVVGVLAGLADASVGAGLAAGIMGVGGTELYSGMGAKVPEGKDDDVGALGDRAAKIRARDPNAAKRRRQMGAVYADDMGAVYADEMGRLIRELPQGITADDMVIDARGNLSFAQRRARR